MEPVIKKLLRTLENVMEHVEKVPKRLIRVRVRVRVRVRTSWSTSRRCLSARP